MKVSELKLTNYRGAQSLRIEFPERLHVFYGVNGAGKSTVLDAIAIMLSWVVSRIRHSGGSGRPLADSDITNGKSFTGIDISCTINQRPIKWRMLKNKKGHTSSEVKSDFQELNYLTKGIQGEIAATAEKVNLPLCVYYSVNRAVLDIPLRIREKHKFNLLAAYDEALTSGANFRTFFEWFREREDLENENRKYKDVPSKPDDYVFPDPQLEAVRTALDQFLPEFSNLTVRRNPLRMEVEKNGKRLTVNQLSDGEKCLIALVGDLARRLAIANPVSANPLEGAGIVLVDEIDLHLHPVWQRMVVPNLLKVFPQCQFIISTHSPHIITHVRPENLYLLKQTTTGIDAEQPRESYGKTVDRILEDLMGLKTTRPDDVDADLKVIFQTINTGTLEDARKQISELRDDIGGDPDLVKAEVLIKRKEIVGK